MTADERPIASERAVPRVAAVTHHLQYANWMLVVLALALLVGSIAQCIYRFTLPTDGWTWISGAVGTSLEDSITFDTNALGQPSPLQRGDFLLAVEGQPYGDLLAQALTLQPPVLPQWRAGTTVRYLVQRDNTTVALDVPLRHWQPWHILRLVFGNVWLFIHLLGTGISVYVLLKRPREFAARVLFLLTVVSLAAAVSDTLPWGVAEIVNPPALLLAQLWSNWIYGGLLAPTVLLLALTFPRPKPFVLRYSLPTVAAVYGTLPLLLLAAGPQPFIGWAWAASCGVLSLVAIGHTLLTARDPISRAQLRWAGLGLGCFALSILMEATSGFGVYPQVVQQVIAVLAPILQLAFPCTLAIAIMRYRLFDIDLILSRALIYGALTLCVIGLYIALVTSLGIVFQSEDNLIASLIATGVVAVVFQPLHLRLHRGVNRLLFGQRNEPYTVITALGRQLEAAVAPNAMFRAIVDTIGQSLKVPYVAITTADETHVHAAFPHTSGTPDARLVRLPLSHQHHIVGVLLVAPRAGEERLTQADDKLLHDLARHIGTAVYAARITADVQRSRERIVVAREEERRRLRRDLHDGLGPQLASQTLTLDVIARLVRSDPDRASALLLTVSEQVQQAVSDIRDLIYGLRPPVLDDLGLNGAIEEWIDRVRQQHPTLHCIVCLPTTQVPLPAALEVAVYRIIQEAVTNVVRHARASVCEIRLERMELDRPVYGMHALEHTTHLVVEVIDNGIGIAADRLSGVGLQSMRERSEELGGECQIAAGVTAGTCIRAVLPMTDARVTDEY